MKDKKRGEVLLHPEVCRNTNTIKQVLNSTGRKAKVSPCGKKVLLVEDKDSKWRAKPITPAPTWGWPTPRPDDVDRAIQNILDHERMVKEREKDEEAEK